jgi:hypothetical protein
MMLKNREEIVKEKRIISSEITKMQKVFFDEEMLAFYKEDDEEHLYREMFDNLHTKIVEYQTFNKVLGLNHSDINTFTQVLSKKLEDLFKIIGASEFYVLTHLKLDFFGNRENDFEPLAKSYAKLENIIKDKTYKEALILDQNELNEFLDTLFWTTRCDPSTAEYTFIFDRDEKIQLHLCKYGNIHLTEFNEERIDSKLLNPIGWEIIEGEEFDRFSTDGKINGRQLKI